MSEQIVTLAEATRPELPPVSEPSTPPPTSPPQGRPALKLEQRALLCFYDDPLRPLAIQEIQRVLGVTYKPAYQALVGLAARGILAEDRSGWARSFHPDVSNPACAREFVLLEWARGEAFVPTLPDGERERVQAFVRRAEEEATPLFIRTVAASDAAPGPCQLVAAIARPEERSEVALLARETGLAVSVATLEAARHILTERPDLATPLVRGVCLQGAEVFVRERFRGLAAHSPNR